MDPLKEDFRKFLFIVWKHLKLPKPTRRQYAIAYYLQHGPDRSVIEAFRGVGKSWVTAAYVLWFLYCNPQLKVLVLSASKVRADNFTTFCLNLINEMEILQHLRPGPEQRCSKISFDVGPTKVDQQPSVTSLGITSSIAGNRADLIVPDDIESLVNSATQSMREKTSEAVKEFDAILKPGGKIKYLGTPQTITSLYNKLPARGYDVKIWPARYPTLNQRLAYGLRLATDILADLEANPELVGKTTEPTRFTDADLAEREMSYGRAGFALQFMLDTSLADVDRYPLKLKDLIVCPLDAHCGPASINWNPMTDKRIKSIDSVGLGGDGVYEGFIQPGTAFEPWQGVCMAIDPSGRGRDETGYAVVARLYGLLFLLDSGAVRGYEPDALLKLSKIAAKFKVNAIVVEKNFGDGMFVSLLNPVLKDVYSVPRANGSLERGCSVEEVHSVGQKEKRMLDVLEPVVSGHRLVVAQHLFDQDRESTVGYADDEAVFYQLWQQFVSVTREKGDLVHDDRLEALSMAVSYWTKAMATDVTQARQGALEKAKDSALKKFCKWFHDKGKVPAGMPGKKRWGTHLNSNA